MRLFAQVRVCVLQQSGRRLEATVAIGTFERSLLAVGLEVAVEEVQVRGLVVAIDALVLFCTVNRVDERGLFCSSRRLLRDELLLRLLHNSLQVRADIRGVVFKLVECVFQLGDLFRRFQLDAVIFFAVWV